MKILLVAPMSDKSAGFWIYNSIIELGHSTAYYDWRKNAYDKGPEEMNNELVNVVKKLKPDLTLILKGVGLFGMPLNEQNCIWDTTIRNMRETHNHTIVGWIFDVTLGGKFVASTAFMWYIRMIKELDKFYTIDEDAIEELEPYGVNVGWLSEGCFPPIHEVIPYNAIQKRFYGSDISFIGNVGGIHPNRSEILSKIGNEGFNLKIYGGVGYSEGTEPVWVKDSHTGYSVFSDMFAIVANASKINLGIDGWPKRSRSYADRVYKVLCGGGFLLTNYVEGIEKDFNIGEHLDVYRDNEDLIEKTIYYLENPEERKRIAENGKQYVLENHKFSDRINYIIKDMGFDQ